MSTVKLNESSLLGMGFDKATVEAFRHILRQVGAEVGAPTLPDSNGATDLLTPLVNSLVIALKAVQVLQDTLEAEQTNLPRSNADLIRRLDDLQSEVQSLTIGNSHLARRVETLENGVN